MVRGARSLSARANSSARHLLLRVLPGGLLFVCIMIAGASTSTTSAFSFSNAFGNNSPSISSITPKRASAHSRYTSNKSALPLRAEKKNSNGGFLDNIFGGTIAASSSSSSTPRVQKPEGFVAPEPKPLAIAESTDIAKFTKNTLAFVMRLGVGAFVLGWKIDTFFYDQNGDDTATSSKKYSLKLGPFSIRDTSSVSSSPRAQAQTLVLYEYESSPYCKRVREMINLLDLTVEYRPCPGARQGKFSDELYEKTGRRTVPYLFDPTTGQGLFESSDQIEYLLTNYGPTDTSSYDRKALWPITFEAFSIVTSTLCAIVLGMPGKQRRKDARPDNEDMLPLELWGNEASPFVRNVRETLGELCLPHTMVSCARGSINRDIMMAKTGRFQVPFLVDPNTGIEMFESEDIVNYLEEVYTTTIS